MFNRKDYKEKQLRYSIRKVSFGAASVAISALYLLMGSAAVSASEVQAVNGDQTTVANSTAKDNEDKSRIEKTEPTTEEANSTVATLDKTELTALIAEIDGNFTNGKYDSKTEESVQYLKTVLEEAKSALNNATIQAELKLARIKLVTATTKLQTKPEDKKQAPAVDTTNGKATVGIKATNTEKAADTNSIANSGSRDERHGKALDRSNLFRTDAATTDTDTAANQTYTEPAKNADLATLADKLKTLPNYIENNKKVQDMDTLGNALNVEKGSVTEINEFGGWKAVGENGKFAIARKTEAGVFPIETVNTVWNDRAKTYVTWVLEQSFNRDSDYMLFLSKVRTNASSNEEAFDNSKYKSTGEGLTIARGVKGFDGIQKTFKAYSKEHGSKVIVSFKTGYTGDIDGTKAKYKVEVIVNRNGHEEKLYDQTFTPEEARKNTEMTVVKASDGTNRPPSFSSPGTPNPTKAELEAKIANNKPNGTGGIFTSKEIQLPEGVTEYTVRISSADNLHLGMGYQSLYRHYALPVTGLDFNIDQDTSAIAKNLLQRVYDKLKETEERDTKGKTEATINAYKTQLENVKNLLAGDLKKTQDYKDIVTAVLADQQALRTDKSKLVTSNNKLLNLINETPDPTIGKTPNSITPYDSAKEEAIKAQTKAQTILAEENPDPEVVAAAVSNLNEKLAELKAARAELVVAATTEQKTKLEESAAKLVKASTDGKTQDSINEYETTYNNLTRELEEAKAKATAIKTAGDNASRLEALTAQEAVDAVLAKLDAAKAKLVDKATEEQKAELAKAEAALTPAEESTLAGTKTPASIAAYKNAVEAIQTQLTEAKTTASDLVTKAGQDNATKAEAAAAIAKVDALKAKLADATALLKDKANTSDLAAAKEELKALAGVANVTDGKTTSTTEAYEAAKRDADAAVTAAEGIINNADSTPEEVATALTNVKAKKAALEAAKTALLDKITQDQKDDLADAEENLKLADTTGKTNDSIKVYNDEVAKLSDDLAAAKQVAKDLLDKGDNAGELEAYRVQAKINKLKSKLAEAAKLLKDIDKSAAKKEVEDAAKKATDAIVANNDLTPEQKEAAKAKVAYAANKANAEIDKVTTENDVTAAKNAGKLAIEKEAAKAEIEAAKAAKEKAIEANDKLSDAEKQAAKKEVAKAADEAKKAIDAATDNAGVDGAKSTGTRAVEAVNPVGKEKALAAIGKALADKEKAIDANEKLSDAEKQAAKEAAKKVADDAKKAINDAQNQEAVDNAKNAGTTAVEAVNPVGKEKALDAIQKATEDKLDEIDRDDKLSEKEKAKAKAEVAKAAINAVNAINEATDQAAVDAKQAEGTKAVSEVNPVGKDKSKAKIEAIKAEKTKAVEANPDLTDVQKAEAKAKIAEEAKKAIDAIDKAKTTEEVASAKESGKLAIEKEAKKAEIEAAKAAKEKAIDARTDLTDDEKAKAKTKVAEEAKKAIEAIEKAKTHDDVSAKTETGKDDIKKINPISGKETAKKAIDEALAEKEKTIDARTDLLPNEKEAAKKAAREAAKAAKNAIDKATTSDDIKKVLDNGLDKIAKVNPLGAKEEAKKSIEERLADKEKEIDARTDLTPEEKAKEKALAREEAKAAKDAIDKATSIEAIEKALRSFLYQIDQDALVLDRPAFDIKAYIQASVTGVVTVEREKSITQADIIAKLNLPENVTVISVDLPDTTTVGRKFAKVTLRLVDGTEATVFVPVEVVEKSEENHQQNNTQEDSKPTVVPSDNSEQPTVNQTEDVKENPSTTSQETKASNQKVLPNTGTGNEISIFGSAAMTVLASLGLVATSKKKEEE